MNRDDADTLDDLARRLRERPIDPPSALLRLRVLDAVQAELTAHRPLADAGHRLGFITGLAASVLIGLTFSVFAGSQAPAATARTADRASIIAGANELRTLTPFCPSTTRCACAFSIRRAGSLVCLPAPRASYAELAGNRSSSLAE